MNKKNFRFVGDGSESSGYEDRFKDYRSEIVWRGSEELSSERDVADISLKVLEGKYVATFVTRKFLDWVFEKNCQTGECGGGAYFSVPRMVVVERLDEENVRRTIDDMINNREIENYFSPND